MDESETILDEKWKECLSRPIREQVEMADDLLQMTYSPLGQSDPADWTLAELIQHGCPPIPWLMGIMRFARSELRAGRIDVRLGTVLYHTALAAGLVNRGARLSRSSDEVILLGLRAALDHPWLDRLTKKLFERAAAELEKHVDHELFQ